MAIHSSPALNLIRSELAPLPAPKSAWTDPDLKGDRISGNHMLVSRLALFRARELTSKTASLAWVCGKKSGNLLGGLLVLRRGIVDHYSWIHPDTGSGDSTRLPKGSETWMRS